MRILLDECVDRRLSHELVGHDVKTAQQMGWRGIKNGELLTLASAHFDVLVTSDRNLSFQQHVSSFPIAIIVMQARTNRLADLKPLVPNILRAIEFARPGAVKVIDTSGPL